jgi:hypothetical protein
LPSTSIGALARETWSGSSDAGWARRRDGRPRPMRRRAKRVRLKRGIACLRPR